MQACYIATIFSAAVTLFTFQTKVDFMSKWALVEYGVSTVVFAGLVHLVEPYWTFSRFVIALVVAAVLCAYFAFGIIRSMSLLEADAKPTVSLAVAVSMIYPFICFTGIGIEDFGH
ncbi:hypothetical protein GGI20_005816 [Coemansia sp. BCRC 34301]|nr:hypothetical protein GGI20_005816 [Coemansia sp. BCRC 34301]